MSDLYNYNRWKNFTKAKLVCQETGKENPNIPQFIHLMDDVQELRAWAGIPFYVTSAYRSPEHSIEIKKETVGQHTLAAIDFQIPTQDCHRIVKRAFAMGFTGIGIKLKGDHNKRFIHLDKRVTDPRIWSY